jgi:hypothetical protein
MIFIIIICIIYDGGLVTASNIQETILSCAHVTLCAGATQPICLSNVIVGTKVAQSEEMAPG